MKLQPLTLIFCSLLVSSADCNDALFEGDIIPDYETIKSAYDDGAVQKLVAAGVIDPNGEHSSLGRGTAPNFPLWNTNMNAKDLYVIFVFISHEYSPTEFQMIRSTLRKFARKSKVFKFRFLKDQPTDGRPYLNYGIYSGMSCASYVGMKTQYAYSSNGQPIILVDPLCLRSGGIIEHETMHALGFWHEQSRPDRDDHVIANWENIRDGKEINFQKQSEKIDSLGAPYDYDSVMHYSSLDFSSNGAPTITPMKSSRIGQREGVSRGDKLQIKLMYQCSPAVGPRTYEEYKRNKCTLDCKCGKDWSGCGSNSEVCKGNLQCLSNKCRKVKQ